LAKDIYVAPKPDGGMDLKVLRLKVIYPRRKVSLVKKLPATVAVVAADKEQEVVLN
jgi:hypothetical protein